MRKAGAFSILKYDHKGGNISIRLKKRNVIILLVVLFCLLVGGLLYIKLNNSQERKVSANTESKTLSTQADWDSGTKTNVASTAGGGVEIQVSGDSQKIDLAGLYASSPDSFQTRNCKLCQSGFTNAFDGDTGTSWSFSDVGGLTCSPAPQFCQLPGAKFALLYFDLGQAYNIEYVKAYLTAPSGAPATGSASVRFSPDFTLGSNYLVTAFDAFFGFTGGTLDEFETDSTAIHADTTPSDAANERYVNFAIDTPSNLAINEIEIYAQAASTHTTSPTQIDGGDNFWEWDSFADTKTTPANTSVTYRYRTSANSTDWTDWVSDFSSVTSRSGDTKYRYLQVEATLSNTDGVSTPTVDQYDIDYHTEQKPAAPTAQTAVVE